MNIALEKDPGWKGIRLTLDGDLDLYSVKDFQRRLLETAGHQPQRVLMDLRGLRYLDSSGVGALIRLLQTLQARRGELRVHGLAGSPYKVLEMCQILRLFKLFPDEAAAVKDWEAT